MINITMFCWYTVTSSTPHVPNAGKLSLQSKGARGRAGRLVVLDAVTSWVTDS